MSMLFSTLFALIGYLAQIFSFLILIRVLLSWLPMSRSSSIANFIYSATEPILEPIRRILPPLGGLDFSPLVAMVLLQVISSLFI